MRFSSLITLLPLAAAGPIAQRSEPAPLHTRSDVHPDMADQYIVKFKHGSLLSSVYSALKLHAVDHTHLFEHSFQGFAAKLSKATLEKLRQLPDIDFIEQDGYGSSASVSNEKGSTWGLARISHHKKGQNSYIYELSGGKGVCVYVPDSGIDDTHPEFEGRAHQIKSFIPDSEKDDFGHGTHCAGTVGSKTYGVAKQVTLYGVKVLSSKDVFKYSDLIAAYDFIAKDSRTRDCPNGVVVSNSLGGAFSQALNDAADKLVGEGFFVASAAGNNNVDASQHSPASADKVCAVGGSDKDDKRYDQSNFGPRVDIVGPAVGVLSTVPGGGTAYWTGTSMATPHIAGLAAYLAVSDGVKASPALCRRMKDLATRGAITNQSPNTVNLIAFNGNKSG